MANARARSISLVIIVSSALKVSTPFRSAKVQCFRLISANLLKLVIICEMCEFLACQCNKIGSISNDCDVESGQCKCLSSFGGERCEHCKDGYYNYPKCQCKF